MIQILIVDDKKSIRDMLAMVLQEKGYNALTANSGQQAMELIQQYKFNIVITDLKMPNMTGLELLHNIRAVSPNTAVILITAYGTVQNAVEAMKLGAIDFIQKPFAIEVIEAKIQQILEKNATLPIESLNSESKKATSNIVGDSEVIKRLYRMIEKVAPTTSSVLIIGESGTGKELVAREIHQFSARRDKSFVAVNCGVFVESLLEDELFGHEPGAFTGAQGLKKGRFELAHQGTLFLDEIAEMPANLQVKLLRVLQEKYIERVGGTQRINVDVRIIAATNKDLGKLMQENKFREDLFYRLNVITVEVPPLRDRKEDIPVLSQYFREKYSQEMKKTIEFSPETLEILVNYQWPGNVRQLRNVIERGIVLSETNLFTPNELPSEVYARNKKPITQTFAIPDNNNISAQIEKIEQEAIAQILTKHNWNQTRAAKELGIGRTALQYKMKKYNLYREHDETPD